MKSLAVRLLLILAVPPLVLLATAQFEWTRSVRQTVALGLAGATFVVTIAAVGFLGIRNDRRRRQAITYDESVQGTDDYLSALFMAGLIDCLAFITGGAVLWLGLIFSGVGILWTLAWLPPSMRHLGIHTGAVIGRDQSTVFSFLADERNASKYIPEIQSVEKITDGPIRRGTQFRTRAQFGDKVVEGVDEIIDYQPPNQLSTRMINMTRPMVDTVKFTSASEGTVIDHRVDTEITYSAALLNQGVMRPLMWLDMRSRRMTLWKRLKQVLESGAEPST